MFAGSVGLIYRVDQSWVTSTYIHFLWKGSQQDPFCTSECWCSVATHVRTQALWWHKCAIFLLDACFAGKGIMTLLASQVKTMEGRDWFFFLCLLQFSPPPLLVLCMFLFAENWKMEWGDKMIPRLTQFLLSKWVRVEPPGSKSWVMFVTESLKPYLKSLLPKMVLFAVPCQINKAVRL